MFYCYPNLKTVTLRIGDKLEIPNYAFWNCDSIIDVVIDSRNSRYEKSEIVINSNAFDGCSSLSTVKYTGKKKEYYIKGDYKGNNSFYNAKQVYNFKQWYGDNFLGALIMEYKTIIYTTNSPTNDSNLV